ncbi:MAG: transglutaminase-like domain-containing protein [Bdellovibrionales bacterium]
MTTLTIKKDSFLTRLFKRNRQEVGRTTTERPPQSKPRKFTRFIVSTGAWLLFSFGATAAINETSRHFTGSYVEELLPRVVAYHQDKNNGFEELKKALTNVHYTTDTSPQSSPSKWPILDKFVPVFPDQPARFYFDRETCLATRSLAFDLRTMKDYYAQRDEFDQYLKEQHSDPFVQERVDTINEVIQHAKKLGYTYSRCATINGFVNMAFPYNEKKRNAGSTDAFYDPKSPYYIEKWANAPQTTIEQNAICIGQAIMKAELLIRCGEKPENVFLLGIKDEKTPHAIVGVKDSENDIFILNNQMYTSEYCAKHNLKEIFSAAATIYDIP